MQELKLHTDSRITLVDVTKEVNRAVAETGVMDSAGCRCNSCEPTGRWA